MHLDATHPLQPLWQLAAAPVLSGALEQALALQLFPLLSTPASAVTVAEALQLDGPASCIWLDLLWSMGLLHRQQPLAADAPALYVSAPLASQYLMPSADAWCGGAWRYRAQVLRQLAVSWPDVLRSGTASIASPPPSGWAQAAREQIAQEQLAITVPAVLQRLAGLPPLPAEGKLLDLGAGPGHVGLALLQQLPGWRGTLCDQPETVDVAWQNSVRAGLAERTESLACDLNNQSFGCDYDLIWCSSVLHFMREPQALLQRIYAALKPGGRVLLAHAELPEQPELAAQVLPYFAGVVLRGHYLPRAGEVPRLMAQAGLSGITDLGTVAVALAPVRLYLGERA